MCGSFYATIYFSILGSSELMHQNSRVVQQKSSTAPDVQVHLATMFLLIVTHTSSSL